MSVLYISGEPNWPGQPVPDFAGQLALRTCATVMCCRYRDVFPAALDDVAEAYRYGLASGQVVVAGDRLGASLAAALLIRLRDEGTDSPPCAVLVSALLDLTLQAPSLGLNAAADPKVDVAGLRRLIGRYAGTTPLTDPMLSPLRANLHGLPPIQLHVAGNDILLDDSVAFAGRAARSGVSVDLRVRPNLASVRADAAQAIAAFIDTRTRS
jgi:acetyl esterase/lipase